MIEKQKGKSPIFNTPHYGKQSRWITYKRLFRSILVSKIQGTPLQHLLYLSYWHYIFNKKSLQLEQGTNQYITIVPNHGAGIGHQLSNWNSALYFSRYFNLKFAHSPFSSNKWDTFFGFGEDETLASDLIQNSKFKKVQLSKFSVKDEREIKRVRDVISSYGNRNVLFFLELDQGCMEQYSTYETLSSKFFKAKSRKNDHLVYDKSNLNIAIHIRRGDIESSKFWQVRGLDNQYYRNILSSVLQRINSEKKIYIYLFSQGTINDFPEFNEIENFTFCLDMGPIDSVLHMINADLLISSKSSFSYKPALISRGVRIVPETFWHKYPNNDKFILADDYGFFDIQKFPSNL